MLQRLLVCVSVALLPLGADAQSADSVVAPSDGATPPTIEIRRAAAEIQLDGELDDGGWVDAVHVTSFTEMAPREGASPAVQTEVLLTYDLKNLYVAFRAHDNPKSIRATLRGRDQIWSDDYVAVLLDPFGDGAAAYLLLSNPLGVQGDLLKTQNTENTSADVVYRTAAKITDGGYQVEMAIPFRSLRFPDRPIQTWRINLLRNVPRSSRHELSWASVSRNNPCFLCQMGVLQGLREVRPGGGLEVLPAVVASQAGRLQDASDPHSFLNGHVATDLSLGAKYAFSSGWVLEGTYNPDFSQVESDAAQIDVNTTFAFSYPERRPFFQEGSDLFATPLNVFYSRSINDPRGATKLTGRLGSTSIGYIGAVDEHTPFVLPFEERSVVLQGGQSVANLLRVRHNLPNGSYIGVFLGDRRVDRGGTGSTASVDAAFRFAKYYRVQMQLVGSHTREPSDSALTANLSALTFGRGRGLHTAAFDGESYGGRALYLSASRSTRRLDLSTTYSEATPTYRAENGFQSRNDYRRASAGAGLNFYPRRSWVDRISPRFTVGRGWNFGDQGKELGFYPGLLLILKRQTTVSFNASASREVFRGSEFEGLRSYGMVVNSNFSDPVQLGFSVTRSRGIARNLATPTLGDGLNASLNAVLKPSPKLVIEPSFAYSALNRVDTGESIFAGYIARTRVNYQVSRELSLRVVGQYNDFTHSLDVEPLLMYRLNPFSIFYIGSTHAFAEIDGFGYRPSQRQVFLKFQYLIRP